MSGAKPFSFLVTVLCTLYVDQRFCNFVNWPNAAFLLSRNKKRASGFNIVVATLCYASADVAMNGQEKVVNSALAPEE